MLLAIDVGNTQTHVGLYGNGPELIDHWRVATNPERTADEHALVVQDLVGFADLDFDEAITGMVLASVVPRVTVALRAMAARYLDLNPVVLEQGIRSGMPILIDNPKEVGADRLANAVAVYDLYGGPSIIVDFSSTAISLDAISARGEFLGSAIAPGADVSLDGLFRRAAALRHVDLVPPRSAIGKGTVEALQSGILYGYASMVDGLAKRFLDVLGEATVVATGVGAELFVPHCSAVQHVEPFLTLHGLRLIHDRNVTR